MEIVIDIPNRYYEMLKDFNFEIIAGRRNYKTIQVQVVNAIKDGTPLPKRHGRLIDADELKKNNEEYIIQYPIDREEDMQNKMVEWINKDIADAPTIIEGSDSE